LTATVALACAVGANAEGVNTIRCGVVHRGANRWTVETILSISENSTPDVTCAVALQTTAAIDGGKGSGVQHTQSPASGQAELVYGKWTCTITNGWHGGAKSTFMAKQVHGQPTFVTCADGIDVKGNVDSFSYTYGNVGLL
jgi:hypothetical protein